MSEYAEFEGDTGWLEGEISVWNETSTNLALFVDLPQYVDGEYGIWAGQDGPVPFTDTGGSSTGKTKHKRRYEQGRGLEYYRAKYEEQEYAAQLDGRLSDRDAQEADRALAAQERETQADIEALSQEIAIYRDARAQDKIILDDVLAELEQLLALAMQRQALQNKARAALLVVLAYFF